MKAVPLLLLALGAYVSEQTHMEYHDDLASSYSMIAKHERELPSDRPFLNEQKIVSPLGVTVAALRQTDPQQVPYDQSEAVIVIDAPNGRHFLRAQGFKYSSARWIDERLFLISRGIGRIGHITEIYDTEERSWLYQQGQTYIERDARANPLKAVR